MRRVGEIASFHAHVYFDGEPEAKKAKMLREAVGERFLVQLGRWHDQAIGPHDRGSYQIAFAPDLFATLVPWLMLNHDGLSILVHANSGQCRRDHVEDSLWIGARLSLNEAEIPEIEDPPEPPQTPNTQPTLEP